MSNRIIKRMSAKINEDLKYDTDKAIELYDKIYDCLKKAETYSVELSNMDPKNINNWNDMQHKIKDLLESYNDFSKDNK